MDYQNIYDTFYLKYYAKTEFLIKHFFIKKYNQNRMFNYSYIELSNFINDKIIKESNIHKYQKLHDLYSIFKNRNIIYSRNQIQSILQNEIKINFSKIEAQELPLNYSFNKLIKEIAFIRLIDEILRILHNDYRLFEMMFQINEFENFAIKEYGNIALEDTEIYQNLLSKLYPKRENNFTSLDLNDSDSNIELEKKKKIDSLFKSTKIYDCFMNYQKHIIDYYIDFSYLKKRLEREQLIHRHKDNDFMRILYEDFQLLSLKNYNEYCITGKLKSLSKSSSIQRENNFNIVFSELL